MSRKKSERSKQTCVKVGNISDISGNVNVAGGNITTHRPTASLSVAEIEQLFAQLYSKVEAGPATSQADRDDIRAEAQEIHSTITEAAQKNEKVDEGFLLGRFRNLARMAPDVLDVIVATLANPLARLGVAVKKIAEKAKEDTEC